MIRAPALRSQLHAAWSFAHPHGFVHAITSREKQKEPETKHHDSDDGSGSKAQARGDIHNHFPLAGFALDRQVLNLSVRSKEEQRMVATLRAPELLSGCQYFITLWFHMQYQIPFVKKFVEVRP